MTAVRVRYQTLEVDGYDIHVRTLRDKQQFDDPHDEAKDLGISSAMWPLFGVVWDSGLVLAHVMARRDVQGLRILEVGCGIGLASLVLNERRADISATDIHPEAGRFLSHNTKLNSGMAIPFVRTDWGDPRSALGDFDLIIGSDLMYQQDHAALLSAFIDQHAAESCEVIMVDPGRAAGSHLGRFMEALGYESTREDVGALKGLDREYNVRITVYTN